MKRPKSLSCVLWLWLVWLGHSSIAKAEFIPAMPEDFDQVDVYLHTIGFGQGIHTAFGHTMVRIVDRKARTDMIFNWGVFDFGDPFFLFKFIYGTTDYRMAIYRMATVMRIYQHERRTLIQDQLNLTAMQKRKLVERIIWNSHKENLHYRYHYYFDNCSTKVRDYFDEALGGAFAAKFKHASGISTLREAIQGHFDDFPFVGMATDVVMNSDLEDHMTAWQEMYLPASLRKYLAMMPQIDDEGRPVPDSSLLGSKQTLLQYEAPGPAPVNGYQILVLCFGFLLAWTGLILMKWKQGWAVRILGLNALFWGGFAGLMGTAMVYFWFISLHVQTYHNANLFLFWPTDLLWILAGLVWLKGGEPLALDTRLGRLLHWNCLGHLVVTPIFFLLAVSGWIKQDVTNPLAYFAPLMLACAGLTWRFGIQRSNPAVKSS